MPIKSRWTEPIPNCSLQKWIFGSSFEPLSDRKAFIDADNPDTKYLTFSDYRLVAKQIAIGLQASGLRPGDRVMVFSGNSIIFPAVFLGVLMAGGIFTGANPGFTSRELAYQLSDSGATFMFSAPTTLQTAVDAARDVGMPARNVFVLDTTVPDSRSPETPATMGTRHWTEILAPRAQAERFHWVEPADARTMTCCLNYSSGTTGVPKGVEISHHSYVANGVGVVRIAKTRDDYEESRKRSVGLSFLPMYHAYGQTYFIANFPNQGMPVYVMPGFDFAKLLSHIQRYRITHLTAVPPILVLLTKHPLARKADLSSLEVVGCGAAPLAHEVLQETEKMMPRQDLYVRQGWGMTEVTCSCISWDSQAKGTSSAVGEMMPNYQAKLMELDGKTEITSAKTPGELWVSGPTLLRGYWRKPEATRETVVVDPDGTRWLKTGDIAYVETYAPGALFHIVDRMKELIKVKGNQVAPAELEALLLERPDVADVAVIGVSVDGMEMPRAYIVPREGTKASAEEISSWLAGKVAKYKRLTGGVVFTDAIPKNPVCAVRSRTSHLMCPMLTQRSGFSPARSCERCSATRRTRRSRRSRGRGCNLAEPWSDTGSWPSHPTRMAGWQSGWGEMSEYVMTFDEHKRRIYSCFPEIPVMPTQRCVAGTPCALDLRLGFPLLPMLNLARA